MEDSLKPEYVVKGSKEYVDARGKISNFELSEPVNWLGLITSTKNITRANHYHPIQEQKVLLINGKYVSVYKDLSKPNSLTESHLILPGDLIVTKPNVAHTMVFLEDSTILNLVRGEREHENFGVHTIPYELVNQEQLQGYVANYQTKCRVCGCEDLKQVVSLGNSPLANNLLRSQDEKSEEFPLAINFCPKCYLCQLSYFVPRNKVFDNYLYVSSTAKSFRDHFENLAVKLTDEYKLNNKSLVVDIGSNDGVFLKPLKERGVNITGVEPAKNVCEIAKANGIDTIQGYFNETIVNDIVKSKGKADIVTAFNVFAHVDDIQRVANNAFKLLKDDGTFIIEAQYLVDTMRDLTFDNIYHEHLYYYSVTSLNEFFKRIGLTITKVEHVNTHGGSVRVYVKKNPSVIDESVNNFLKSEENLGIRDFKTYSSFADRIYKEKENVEKKIREIKSQGKKIVGYGAPAKATTVLNFFGIDYKDIDFIVEDNKLKHNLFVPGVKIPIKDRSSMQTLPDYVLILAWNFAEDIKRNNKDLADKDVKFITLR